ncbi:MAG: Slp family lipoprotein [Granulosicoccus sp.]
MNPVPILYSHFRRVLQALTRSGRISALLSVSILLLAGCVTPAPQGEVSTLTVGEARVTAPATPSPVRWGGTITRITNLESGVTQLEVVSRPLRSNGRPLHNDKSDGRFLAEVNEFLDPEIIKVGRDITLTGTVSDVREGTIGKAVYRFPLVVVDNYHYWNVQPVKTQQHFSHWNQHDPFHHGHSHSSFWHDDFFHDWPFEPRHRGTHVRGQINF